MMEALGGHLCRCTGYETIFKAFKRIRERSVKNKRSKNVAGKSTPDN
jgi:xanthine dehydrogenase iron-sulfur cluster and FAD-binding subunit A